MPVPYCGAGPNPSELLMRWNLDPLVVIPLAVVSIWLITPGARERVRSPWLAAALLVLAVSFVSPLCALSSALFSARVTHDALLVTLAAPLLVYALPPKRTVRLGALPASLLHAVLFWVWHAPAPYAAALSHDGLYWLMQASLLGSAVLLWQTVRAAAPLAGATALFATMVQTGLLGALLTFAGQPLYGPHLATTAAWSLSPLADQQLGGLIMWAPMAGAYLICTLMLVGRTLERDAPRETLA